MSPDAGGALLTVGYEGHTAAELVDLLRGAGVNTLVDVRLTPLSRKTGLSKRKLADALAAAGIEYRHRPQLGNPRDNREAYRRGDPQAQQVFAAVLAEPEAERALREVRELADTAIVALLCVEREPDRCHRLAVADALGVHVEHL